MSEMVGNYKFTEDAKKAFEEKLPPNVGRELRERFQELADDPNTTGPAGVDQLSSIGPDHSYFYINFVYHFDDEGELIIDSIEIDSY